MKRLLLVLSLMLLPATVFAQFGSESIADLFYPSYGYAEHYDGVNEHFGDDFAAADGISWDKLTAGRITTFSIAVSVGDFFGVGNYYNVSVWADWDGNRTFEAPEQIINVTNEYFDLGITVLTFEVLIPETAYTASETWLRARLDWYGDGDLASDGFYYTGEVEDYAINIGEPIPEPATLVLLGLGLVGTAIASRRKRS